MHENKNTKSHKYASIKNPSLHTPTQPQTPPIRTFSRRHSLTKPLIRSLSNHLHNHPKQPRKAPNHLVPQQGEGEDYSWMQRLDRWSVLGVVNFMFMFNFLFSDFVAAMSG